MQTIFTPKGYQITYIDKKGLVRNNFTMTEEIPDFCPYCGESLSENDRLSVEAMSADVERRAVAVTVNCAEDFDGCGRSFIVFVKSKTAGQPAVDNRTAREAAERGLLERLHALRRDFWDKDRCELSGDPNVIFFVPCEGNYGICAVPEVQLGPLGMSLDKADLNEGEHAELTFIDREFELVYNTADLDAEFLGFLSDLLDKCRKDRPRTIKK